MNLPTSPQPAQSRNTRRRRMRGMIWRLGALAAAIATGGVALAQGGDSYESGQQVYAGVRRLPAERIEVGGGEIDVHFADAGTPYPDEVIVWV